MYPINFMATKPCSELGGKSRVRFGDVHCMDVDDTYRLSKNSYIVKFLGVCSIDDVLPSDRQACRPALYLVPDSDTESFVCGNSSGHCMYWMMGPRTIQQSMPDYSRSGTGLSARQIHFDAGAMPMLVTCHRSCRSYPSVLLF